ncbi:MAG: hypothetical protein KDD40_05800 [Bdellovibrionales bacterium]|nr:hypothetical protein [Bdellovibrionales bacterium]
MTSQRYVTFILILTILTLSFSLRADEEYRQELKFLNNRYRDFYIHEAMKARMNQERQKGADALRKKRHELLREHEQARLNFIKRKKTETAEPDWDLLEKTYLKKKEQEAEERDQERQKFVTEQAQLKKIKEQAKNIPQTKEVGLE